MSDVPENSFRPSFPDDEIGWIGCEINDDDWFEINEGRRFRFRTCRKEEWTSLFPGFRVPNFAWPAVIARDAKLINPWDRHPSAGVVILVLKGGRLKIFPKLDRTIGKWWDQATHAKCGLV